MPMWLKHSATSRITLLASKWTSVARFLASTKDSIASTFQSQPYRTAKILMKPMKPKLLKKRSSRLRAKLRDVLPSQMILSAVPSISDTPQGLKPRGFSDASLTALSEPKDVDRRIVIAVEFGPAIARMPAFA